MIMKVKTPLEAFMDATIEQADLIVKAMREQQERCFEAQKRALVACHRLHVEWSLMHNYTAMRQVPTAKDGRLWVLWQDPKADYE